MECTHTLEQMCRSDAATQMATALVEPEGPGRGMSTGSDHPAVNGLAQDRLSQL